MTHQQDLLNFLAQVFVKPPDREILTVLKSSGFLSMAQTLCQHDEVASLLENQNELVEILHLEYSRLFSVPGGHYVAPYESYYKDTWHIPLSRCYSLNGAEPSSVCGTFEKLLYGDSTVSVRKLYEMEGLSPNQAPGLLPDHISVELSFLSYLLEQELQAEKRKDILKITMYRKKQLQFLKQHLFPFTEMFAKNLEEKATLPFYPLFEKILYDLLNHVRLKAQEEKKQRKGGSHGRKALNITGVCIDSRLCRRICFWRGLQGREISI